MVRNLCLDWQRKRFGRPRLFRSVARLSDLDQQIFRLVHERGATEQEALLQLSPTFPELTPQQVSQAIERLNQALTSNQNWLLKTRTALDRRPAADQPEHSRVEAISPQDDPEALAILAERSANLRQALRKLPANERLLVRLRFEEEMTLEQISKLLQLGNPQRVDREIKRILLALRTQLHVGVADESGKIVPSSVKAS